MGAVGQSLSIHEDLVLIKLMVSKTPQRRQGSTRPSLLSAHAGMAQEEEGPLLQQSETSSQAGLEENARARRTEVGL